jgi:hypothetical protein
MPSPDGLMENPSAAHQKPRTLAENSKPSLAEETSRAAAGDGKWKVFSTLN